MSLTADSRISRGTSLKAMEACPCPSSFLSQGQVCVRRDKMSTTLRGPMTSEHRGSFHTAVLRLGDPVSCVPPTHRPQAAGSLHGTACMRFRDRALSWPETLRSKKKVPSLGRRGPEARGLASGRILGPGHLGRCLCAVCKLHSYNTPLDHVERNAGATSVLEKRL